MNEVVIVTGASRGIGAATAMRLASDGYAVAVNYHSNTSAAESVVDEIISAGGKAIAVQADVADDRAVKKLFEAVNDHFGMVNYLVNNVGVLETQAALADISYARFKRIMTTNMDSCFLCCKQFIEQCPSDGAIVNVSSAASKSGAPFEYIDYAASKGAMDAFTKGLATELAAQNIRVNAVRPGFIATDIHADGGEPDRVARLANSMSLAVF